MKKVLLYKKWNLVILLNNAVNLGFLTYKQKIVFLHFDSNNFFFWIYNKQVYLKNIKILKFKKKFNFN